MNIAKKRILVVDDEPGVASILKLTLEEKGYEVQIAYSGEECLKLIAGEFRPDLVVLDLILPQQSGYEVCAKLKIEFSVEFPVVIHTACTKATDEHRSYLCKADAFIMKPYSNQQLEGTIKKLLNE